MKRHLESILKAVLPWRSHQVVTTLIALSLWLGAAVPAFAAIQIEQVSWGNSGEIRIATQPGSVTGSSAAPQYRISEQAKGSQQKLTLTNASLPHSIPMLAGRGEIKNVFTTEVPSSASPGQTDVVVDIFLKRPADLNVTQSGDGLAIRLADTSNNTARSVNRFTRSGGKTSARSVTPPKSRFSRSTVAPPAIQNKREQEKTRTNFDRQTIRQQSYHRPASTLGNGLTSLQLVSDSGQEAIELKFSGAAPTAHHFLVNQPPQLIIDLPNTPNRLGKANVPLGSRLFSRAQLAGDSQRLRVIVSLSRASRFETVEIPGGVRFRATSGAGSPENRFSPTSSRQSSTRPAPLARVTQRAAPATHINRFAPTTPTRSLPARSSIPQTSSTSRQHSPRAMATTNSETNTADIDSIDFRRTANGGGRVIVKLNNPDIKAKIDRQGSNLIARFANATLAPGARKRLDVTDFATPVQTIDLLQHGNDIELRIAPNGNYRHQSSQTGREYVVDVLKVSEAEIPAASVPTDSKTYTGEKLSLNFQKIQVRSALQVIADFSGKNIIASDSVSGDLALRLNDVPWDQALDLILQTKNLDMRENGNVIRVAPTEELAEQERKAFEAQHQVRELEPLVTELIRVNYAKAEEIAALLKSVKAIDTGIQQSAFGTVSVQEVKTDENTLLSERGSVTVDKRTNTLLVQDTATRIRDLKKLIARLDIPVKQIQIETRIVEATDDFSRSLGARLGFTRVTKNARLPGASGNSNIGDVYGSGTIDNNGSVRTENEILYPDSLSVNLPADSLNGNSAASYAYQIVKIGANFIHLLDLELSALQAEGKGKIIANPKITTTDKHEARIEQGQERVFTSSSLLQGGTTTKKAVLGLVVTPQVTPDNQIILDVSITNDSFAAADTLNTKQIETQTLLKNGETVVIGGIYQQEQADAITKTPILGDLPLIGNLFKKRTRRDNRTELLIFLTPRIINSAADSSTVATLN